MVSHNGVKSFAVAGIGTIGEPLANEVLASGLSLTILTRESQDNSKFQKYEKQGASIKTVDYASETSLISALQGIDVIISALGGAASADGTELRLAKAGKTAGAKVIFPSLWGSDYVADKIQKQPIWPGITAKLKNLDALSEIGLPWIAIANGIFANWAISPAFGFDAQKRAVVWPGDSDQQSTFTNLKDVARFALLVATKLPIPSSGSGQWYRVEGFRASYNDVFAELQRNDGKWDIQHVAIDRAASNQTNQSLEGLISWLFSCIDDGRNLFDGNDNELVNFSPQYNLADSVREAIHLIRADT